MLLLSITNNSHDRPHSQTISSFGYSREHFACGRLSTRSGGRPGMLTDYQFLNAYISPHQQQFPDCPSLTELDQVFHDWVANQTPAPPRSLTYRCSSPAIGVNRQPIFQTILLGWFWWKWMPVSAPFIASCIPSPKNSGSPSGY